MGLSEPLLAPHFINATQVVCVVGIEQFAQYGRLGHQAAAQIGGRHACRRACIARPFQ
jgi:hypothetical protein